MTEETQNNQAVNDQTADAGSMTSEEVIDWEKKYHEEVKQSKSYRSRAQNAEEKLTSHETEQQTARKEKMKNEGKLQQIIDEQDTLIKSLRDKADAGEKYLQSEKERLLNELPEEDREDFKDLPVPQIRKIVNKFSTTQTQKAEIPAVKGAVTPSQITKPWSEMNDCEKRAFYAQKAQEQAQSMS